MKILIFSLVLALGVACQPHRPRVSYAGGPYGGANSFAARIAHGERTGLLTRGEAARLWSMERDLRREMERSARSGFGVSGQERQRVARMADRLDREIARQMRDGDRYGNYRGGPNRW